MTDRLVQVIILVDGLESARRWATDAGLTAVDGGRHPGRGTANLIVPFGAQYLELLAVVDVAEASASPDGRVVLDALRTRGQGLARWSVETDDIAAAGERLGLAIEDRQRERPDGGRVRWRSVGVNEAWAEPWKCAFMTWVVPASHPARTAVTHPCGATGFARLDLDVPDDRALRAWLGGPPPEAVACHTSDGPALVGLALATPAGPMPIDRGPTNG